MPDPRPLFCPRCGAEVHSALPLCVGCGAQLPVALAATALRPEGFGWDAATGASAPFAPARPAPLEERPAHGAALFPPARHDTAPLIAAPAVPFLAPAAMPSAIEATALAPAPLEPTPAPPPVVLTPVVPPIVSLAPPAAAPPAGGKKRRRKQARSAEEAAFAQYGLAPPPAAEAPPAAVAPYPPATDAAPYPPAPELLADQPPPPALQWGHAPRPAPWPPAYVPQPLAVPQGGSAAKPEALPKVSALAIVGFILALACGPLGLVLSLIAFARIKASKGRLRGEWVAVLGVVVGVVFLLLYSMGKQNRPKPPKRAAVTLTLPAA
jgi:hypothetical protein